MPTVYLLITYMKKTIFLRAFALSAFCLLLSAFSLSAQPSPIVILHTNDTHSHLESFTDKYEGNDVGGALRRNTFIQETRKEYPNTLLVDAGDFSQGTAYFNLFKGFPEIELMNKMGYDAVALGNHEFDNGLKALAKRLKIADFKILCANYLFKNKQLAKIVKPYTIIHIAGKKIGFFGLLCDLENLVLPDVYKETTYLDPIAAAQKMVDILKNQEQCDLIICLSHLGIDSLEFSEDITDSIVAEKVPGIDFIIGGHTHKLLKEPLVMNNTKILQAKLNGIYIGKLVISD